MTLITCFDGVDRTCVRSMTVCTTFTTSVKGIPFRDLAVARGARFRYERRLFVNFMTTTAFGLRMGLHSRKMSFGVCVAADARRIGFFRRFRRKGVTGEAVCFRRRIT